MSTKEDYSNKEKKNDKENVESRSSQQVPSIWYS